MEWIVAMLQGSEINKETPNLGELYQEIIVEHSKRPRCKGRVEGVSFVRRVRILSAATTSLFTASFKAHPKPTHYRVLWSILKDLDAVSARQAQV